MQRIYLDHNATTPVDPAVLEAMLPFLSGEFGNPSSVHSCGQRARAAIERARASVAALIGAQAGEIVFTSGGTESDNAAIFGAVASVASLSVRGAERRGIRADPALPRTESAPHIVTTSIEHHAVLHPCRALESRGVAVTCVAPDRNGVVDPAEIRRALRPETVLVSVMHANNEIGTLQPIAEIAAIAREGGALLHTDAVQSAGKVPIRVGELGADLLSLSAHKFGGPKGAGALYIRKGVEIAPLLYGGPNERDRRAGTENVAGIAGMGKAAELAPAHLAGHAARVGALRDRLEQGLLARIPGARVTGAASARVPNTTNILFPGADSESLIIALDLQGLACSAGAACAAGAVNPSHVLTAVGLTAEEVRASVRLSLGPSNTEEEITRAIDLIASAVSLQRAARRTAAL